MIISFMRNKKIFENSDRIAVKFFYRFFMMGQFFYFSSFFLAKSFEVRKKGVSILKKFPSKNKQDRKYYFKYIFCKIILFHKLLTNYIIPQLYHFFKFLSIY